MSRRLKLTPLQTFMITWILLNLVGMLSVISAEGATNEHVTPLLDGIGDLQYPITTSNPEAQRYSIRP